MRTKWQNAVVRLAVRTLKRALWASDVSIETLNLQFDYLDIVERNLTGTWQKDAGSRAKRMFAFGSRQ